MITPDLKESAVHLTDLSQLFELMINIQERIGSCHIAKGAKKPGTDDRLKIESDIRVLDTIYNIVCMRIEDVKTNDVEKRKRDLMAYRQFKIAAEAVLQKDTFEKIKELSSLQYTQLKHRKEELRMNKLE